MYTVRFFVKKHHSFGEKDTLEERVIKTGKTTVAEAFEVALQNGLVWHDTAQYIWEDKLYKVYKQKDNDEKVLLKSFASEIEARKYIYALYKRARAKKLYIWKTSTSLQPKDYCVTGFEFTKAEFTDARGFRNANYSIFFE